MVNLRLLVDLSARGKRLQARFLGLPARTRALLIVLAALALFTLVDLALSAGDDEYFHGDDKALAFTVDDASVVGWGSSTRRWKLTARKVYMMQNARQAVFKGVEGATLYREGEPVLKIRAREVQLDMLSHNFDVRGEIDIDYSAFGSTFQASHMHWDARTELLTTRGGITIRKTGMDLRAGDLEINMKTGDIRFESVDIFMSP